MDRAREARVRAAETKKRRSQAAVLAAAEGLFERQGWYPTTVEAIAKEAGVGTATVYSHFGTKNQLAGLVYRPVIVDLLDDQRWVDPAVPARAALSQLIAEISERARQRTALTIALLEAVNDSTARNGSFIDENDPRAHVPLPLLFVRVIERGQVDGSFLTYPPAREAGPLLANLLLLRVLTRPTESSQETTRLMQTVANRLMGVEEHAVPQ